MTDKTIAAPLAAALAAKGYASLTSVQQAVLESDAEGRDMLVSAQTGSGKTVAFGLAIAPQLLDGDTLPDASAPLGLAIAPTRELALQVAAELGWLYAHAGARIATCVGGMDYRNERRALDRGAHIVVGTPGRLRDHIERGSLDLSGLRVAVLDEADEMLDLGFRDDLEFILQAAPAERRTLMFSATVPPAIEHLAGTFQRDARRIVAQGESRQHGDIEYRAFNVAARDREPAIFNILRLHEAQTAIIFCKTRANVGYLLARMANRGFKAVALSGELSQQERTHALQALRDGRAQVCVATDVAARGIDLPGLELVIHADLPTNPDTLLHRSGRTGRAGAKGISALIVLPSEVRKAQMLLKRARVDAEWGPAPSADDVRARDDTRMLEHPALQSASDDDAALAASLLDRFGAERLAQAFVSLWRAERPAPEELTVVQDRAPAAARERPPFGEAVWFRLSVGHTGRAEARWLLPKICEGGGITRDAIGAIRVRQDETFVQIAAAQAGRFGQRMELEPDLTMQRIEGEPDLDRAPPSGERRPPRDRADGDRKTPAPRAETQDQAPAKVKKPRWTAEERAAKQARPERDGARPDKPGGFRAKPGKPAGAKDRGKFAAPARGGKPRKGDR
ncbi:DEAD/DEAH box helicase [Paracoccus sediminis]|uniref:ATP-dependent RNA helicase DeaD n=1 Tax=Paracoccus sediminis TaxID=1214787 RepID=A0A238WD27_9RHOB|nr:DEAD/DEAH box helicase [Paracoccus sediminis]TBN50944.1 DEAD/DEAH box helicase [Paracoccus sediminis]SNR44133.1 ATP-dependent RNA helicase DeaD [Paracoccus sediminis]